MKGPLTGQQLEMLPSTITDWQTWSNRYPETTVVVLSRIGNGYRNKVHRYGLGGEMGGLLIGLAKGNKSKDWSFSQLRKHPVVNSQFDDEPVLVCFHRASGTAVIFSRLVDGRELSFEFSDGQLVDRETKTNWDMVTGRALTPPQNGLQLKQLTGIVSLTSPWDAFHVFNISAEIEDEIPPDKADSP